MWTSLFTIVVDLLVVLFVVNAPLQFYVRTQSTCVQMWAVLFSSFLVFPFLSAIHLIRLIENPTAAKAELARDRAEAAAAGLSLGK